MLPISYIPHTLRLMAVGLLTNGDELLMMKRSLNRTISPGKWAAVGGHLEPEELARPFDACLREIEEETGLTPSDLEGLQLKYILLRMNGTELRQQFFYTGRALRRETTTTDEGDLHWIPLSDALNRDLPYIFRALLEHWLTIGRQDDRLYMGMVTAELEPASAIGQESAVLHPVLRWVPVRDPGVV